MSDITNAFIDVVKARRDYRDFKWARIADVWSPTFAEQVIQNIVRNVAFINSFTVSGEQMGLTDEQLNKLDKDKQQQLFQEIHLSAAEGKGYLYGKREFNDSSPKIDVGALKDAVAWLNSEQTLEMVSDISGERDLTKTYCVVTRFSQGQFMSSDPNNRENAAGKVAFILDLTPDWLPDWGGQLQLHAAEDEPSVSFTPKFNNLILFDASRSHSISYLAPYIKYYKYSLMGWFA